MCYAIISDIHDNIPNLKIALDHANNIKASALFVLGDITNADTLEYIGKNFSRDIYLVSGNMEVCDLATEAKKYPQIHYLGRQGGVIKIGQHTVGLCHEPSLIKGLLRHPKRNETELKDPITAPSIIFYGHTHKPWSSYAPYSPRISKKQSRASEDKEENENGVKLINPGNLANTFYGPSFAVWDEQTNKLELKIL